MCNPMKVKRDKDISGISNLYNGLSIYDASYLLKAPELQGKCDI